MQKKREVQYALFGTVIAAALAFSFVFDKSIIRFLDSFRGYYLSEFFLGIKFLDNEILVVVLITLFLALRGEKRKWILPTWMTVLFTGIIVFALKILVHRQRPFVQGIVSLLPGIANSAGYHTWDFSFPSFDSALVFCLIPVVWKFFPRFRWAWIAFSVLVALSRVYFGVHFMSDIISGAVIGFIIGALAVKLEKEKKFGERIYSKIFGKK